MPVRPDSRRLAAAVAAVLLVGAAGDFYVRAAIPLYRIGSEWLIQDHPWQIDSLSVQGDAGRRRLQMRSELRVKTWDREPAALVQSRLQLAAAKQNAVVFWPLLLLLPAGSMRRRLVLLALALPAFLVLEVATTSAQLVSPLMQTAAVIGGEADPLTPWERWSRFLEAGGRVALDVCAALGCWALMPLMGRLRRPEAEAAGARC